MDWYFSPSYSWGYGPLGVPRTSCDTSLDQSELRLCWHTNNGSLGGGWRCGDTRGLNGSVEWERLILQRPGGL